MKDTDERKITVIDGIKTEETSKTVKKMSHQTNPIVRKLLEFHNENAEKFNVKDLFKT